MTDPINRSNNRAIKLTQAIRDEYDKHTLVSDPKVLISYYSQLVEAQYKSLITEREAAFLIADTVFYKAAAENPDVEVIVLVASEIEKMEPANICPKSKKHWDNLARFIRYQHETYQHD